MLFVIITAGCKIKKSCYRKFICACLSVCFVKNQIWMDYFENGSIFYCL